MQGPRLNFNFNTPEAYFFFGNPDTGKSNQSIATATNFLANGHKVIDAWGAEAGAEEMIWFLSPYKDRAIMIYDDDVEVDTNLAKTPLSKFTFEVFKDYDIAVTTRGLYGSQTACYYGLHKIFQMCQNRRGWKKSRTVIALMIREAWNVIYSQMNAGISRDEQAAQMELKKMNKERFHTGIAPLLDSQRYMEIDTSVRQLTNFRIIKGFGGQNIPDEFDFMFKPHLFGPKDEWGRRKRFGEDGPWKLRNMPPNEFVMLASSNAVAKGLVDKVPWNTHKGEYLIDELGIIVHPIEKREESKPASPSKSPELRTPITEQIGVMHEHQEMKRLRAEALTVDQIVDRMNLPDRPMTLAKVKYHLYNHCSCRLDG